IVERRRGSRRVSSHSPWRPMSYQTREEHFMTRRLFLSQTLGVAVAMMLHRLAAAATQSGTIEKVVKTDDEWRKVLTPQQFSVLRQEGTETPFTSPLNNEKR